MTKIPEDHLGFFTPMKRLAPIPRKAVDQRLEFDNLYNNHYPDKEMTPHMKKTRSRHNMSNPQHSCCNTDILGTKICYVKAKNEIIDKTKLEPLPSRNIPHPKTICRCNDYKNGQIGFPKTKKVKDEKLMETPRWPCEDQHLTAITVNKPQFDETACKSNFQDQLTKSRVDSKCLTQSFERQRIYRRTYQNPPAELLFASKPGRTAMKVATKGAVPLLADSQLSETKFPKVWEERITYQTNNDSRNWDNKPPQGKCHGSFTWTEIKEPKTSQSGARLPACSQVEHSLQNKKKGNNINHKTSVTKFPKLVG